jgi:hypothetical protein
MSHSSILILMSVARSRIFSPELPLAEVRYDR